MNVFVAGASRAIGRPLVAELVRRRHAVTGMTHSGGGAEAPILKEGSRACLTMSLFRRTALCTTADAERYGLTIGGPHE